MVLPRIIGYEIRRELNRLGIEQSLYRLDMLDAQLEAMEVDERVLLVASHLWAQARRRGVATADRQHLDIDMILCAHALVIAERNPFVETVIATTNVRHLRNFADARNWASIA